MRSRGARRPAARERVAETCMIPTLSTAKRRRHDPKRTRLLARPIVGPAEDREQCIAHGEFRPGVDGDQRNIVADGQRPADIREIVAQLTVEAG